MSKQNLIPAAAFAASSLPAAQQGWLNFIPYRILLETDTDYPGVVFITADSCGMVLQATQDYAADDALADVVGGCIRCVDKLAKDVALQEKIILEKHGFRAA